jgi:hypothetical protein
MLINAGEIELINMLALKINDYAIFFYLSDNTLRNVLIASKDKGIGKWCCELS